MTGRDATEPPEARETQPGTAGALLRAARESTGMTIDAVAQHLKLAPRQVKAIENGDYKDLPGRTFVRGFVRNYARLVHLDPERVVSALPGGGSAPALEAPTLSPTTHTMGELPTTERPTTTWARWAIPSVLAAIVVVAGVYEWMRPAGESSFTGIGERSGATQKEAASHTAPTLVPSPAAPAAPTVASTPLPNPVASNAQGNEGGQAATSDSSSNPTAMPSATGATPPAAVTSAATGTAPASGGASAASGTAQAAAGATAAAAKAPAPGEQTVVVAFRNNSWTEIRDRDGRVLLTGLNRAGTAQTVSGVPPLTIRIGNANDVTLRYKGERVDLAPHTQKNVARLTLR